MMGYVKQISLKKEKAIIILTSYEALTEPSRNLRKLGSN
jgi:hypothetical protein